MLHLRLLELQNQTSDLSEKVEAAFGPEGLGICTVSGVPGFAERRQTLLPLAHRLADLPEETRAKLEDPASKWSFGWSHGKEVLENGRPDTLKGSFYANPLCDCPTDDPDLIKRYPSYCRRNLWPTSDLPELEEAFKSLGRLIVEVGLLLAEKCDQYVRKRTSHPGAARLTRVIREARTTKARLLHYFPPSDASPTDAAADASSWCGWHTDHGSLTGTKHVLGVIAYQSGSLFATLADLQKINHSLWCSLESDEKGLEPFPEPSSLKVELICDQLVSDAKRRIRWSGPVTYFIRSSLLLQLQLEPGLTSAMYFRKGKEVPCPDASAGLYIRNRRGALVKAVIPPSDIGFQMGEATQIHSGGLLRATPHCVRGISGPAAADVSRATLAVFMQPQWDEVMDIPPGVAPGTVEVGAWTPGLDFGAFTERTVSKNYTRSTGGEQ